MINEEDILLKAIEAKRKQLYQIAYGMDLTSYEVVACSCELDQLLNKYDNWKRKQKKKIGYKQHEIAK